MSAPSFLGSERADLQYWGVLINRARVWLDLEITASLPYQGFEEQAEGDAQGWSAQGSDGAGGSKRGIPLHTPTLQSTDSSPFPGLEMHGSTSEGAGRRRCGLSRHEVPAQPVLLRAGPGAQGLPPSGFSPRNSASPRARQQEGDFFLQRGQGHCHR